MMPNNTPFDFIFDQLATINFDWNTFIAKNGGEWAHEYSDLKEIFDLLSARKFNDCKTELKKLPQTTLDSVVIRY